MFKLLGVGEMKPQLEKKLLYNGIRDLQKQEFSDDEKDYMIKAIKDIGGYSHRELSQLLGFSKSKITYHLTSGKATELKKLKADGEITKTEYAEAIKRGITTEEEYQEYMLNSRNLKTFLDEIIKRLYQYNHNVIRLSLDEVDKLIEVEALCRKLRARK